MAADGSDDKTPKPGDATICVQCNSLAIFEVDRLRMPTPDEMHELMLDPDVHRALAQKAVTDQLFGRLKKKPSEEGSEEG